MSEWGKAINEMREACAELFKQVPRPIAENINHLWDNVMAAYAREENDEAIARRRPSIQEAYAEFERTAKPGVMFVNEYGRRSVIVEVESTIPRDNIRFGPFCMTRASGDIVNAEPESEPARNPNHAEARRSLGLSILFSTALTFALFHGAILQDAQTFAPFPLAQPTDGQGAYGIRYGVGENEQLPDDAYFVKFYREINMNDFAVVDRGIAYPPPLPTPSIANRALFSYYDPSLGVWMIISHPQEQPPCKRCLIDGDVLRFHEGP